MPPLTEAEWARIMEGWDACHPANSDEDETCEAAEEYNDEAFELVPRIPTLDELPAVVDYSIRGEGDFVISGRLVGGPGRGPVFDTELRAFQAACVKYGSGRVSRWDAGVEGRWAFLIKKA